MRLFNFAIVAGTKEVAELESTLPTRNLVVSGVVGQDNLDLDKKQIINLFPTSKGLGSI